MLLLFLQASRAVNGKGITSRSARICWADSVDGVLRVAPVPVAGCDWRPDISGMDWLTDDG